MSDKTVQHVLEMSGFKVEITAPTMAHTVIEEP